MTSTECEGSVRPCLHGRPLKQNPLALAMGSTSMEVTVLGHKSKKLEEPTKDLDYDTFVSETEDSEEE